MNNKKKYYVYTFTLKWLVKRLLKIVLNKKNRRYRFFAHPLILTFTVYL